MELFLGSHMLGEEETNVSVLHKNITMVLSPNVHYVVILHVE